MNANDYQKAALRTEKTPNFIWKNREATQREEPADRVLAAEMDMRLSRLMHAVLGMVTELGELCDPLKRHLIYDAPFDQAEQANCREEIGDQSWYGSLAADALEAKLVDILDRNIAKLRVRFPDKFTEEKALNRDLDAELKVLSTDSWRPDDIYQRARAIAGDPSYRPSERAMAREVVRLRELMSTLGVAITSGLQP